jgi:hypothetical protein
VSGQFEGVPLGPAEHPAIAEQGGYNMDDPRSAFHALLPINRLIFGHNFFQT